MSAPTWGGQFDRQFRRNPIVRYGVMQFSQPAINQITLAGNADFNSAQGTITFWMRTLGNVGRR